MVLKELRRAKNLTLRAVSEATGISLVHLCRLETGVSDVANMRLGLAIKLADLYGCAVTDLTKEAPDNEN